MALAASLTTALPQTVDFNNTRTFATTADRRIYDCVGGLVGTQWAAQLLYGSSASSLAPVTSNPTTFRNVPPTDALAGTWIGGTRTLSGLSPGQTAVLQVAVWDSTGGATFQTALRRGLSQTFSYLIPVPGSPPSAFFIENFRSFTVCIPEPSGIGLALLGVFAIFMLKRRSRSS